MIPFALMQGEKENSHKGVIYEFEKQNNMHMLYFVSERSVHVSGSSTTRRTRSFVVFRS